MLLHGNISLAGPITYLHPIFRNMHAVRSPTAMHPTQAYRVTIFNFWGSIPLFRDASVNERLSTGLVFIHTVRTQKSIFSCPRTFFTLPYAHVQLGCSAPPSLKNYFFARHLINAALRQVCRPIV